MAIVPTQFEYDNFYVKRFVLQSSVKNQVDEAITNNNSIDVVNTEKRATIIQKKNSDKLSKKRIQNNKVSSL